MSDIETDPRYRQQFERAEGWMRRARELERLVADLQAHAKEHGWQDVDEPIAALLDTTYLPAAPEGDGLSEECIQTSDIDTLKAENARLLSETEQREPQSKAAKELHAAAYLSAQQAKCPECKHPAEWHMRHGCYAVGCECKREGASRAEAEETAQPAAGAPEKARMAADPFGYCAICYHPLDRCSHCDAAPRSVGGDLDRLARETVQRVRGGKLELERVGACWLWDVTDFEAEIIIRRAFDTVRAER